LTIRLDQVEATHNEIVSTAITIEAIIALAATGKRGGEITVLDMRTSVATATLQVVRTEIVVALHRDYIPSGDPLEVHGDAARSKEDGREARSKEDGREARSMRLRETERGDDDRDEKR
jgi:hypothetical protein